MTVLIADDNTLIRNWLKIMLQQLDSTLEVLESADGSEALETCLAKPVDLLITDIKMPGMDGISLIRTLQKQRPGILSAVLSSYDDFSYVRIALQCGALDYILKAEMKQEDINSLMQKARDMRSLSRSGEDHLARYGGRIRAAVEAYDHFVQGLDGDGTELLRVCGLGDAPAGAALVLLHVHRPEAEMASSNIAPICCHVLAELGLQGVAVPTEGEGFLMLYRLPDGGAAVQQEQHMRLLSMLEQSLEAARAGSLRQNVSVTISASDTLSKKLRYAQSLIDYQIYYGCSGLPSKDAASRDGERRFLEKMQGLLPLRDHSYACSLLRQYVTQRHAAGEMPHRIRRAVTTAAQMMLGVLPADSQSSEEFHHLDRLAQELSTAKSSDRLSRKVDQFCRLYVGFDGECGRVSPAVAQAIDYCNEHYGSRITLEELAGLVRLNKSYFSQLFHKEMGVPFGDYLENVRVRRAQSLLYNSSKSMSEIAEQVGFASQNYFTKVFKKATGLTPSQYRMARRGGAEEP